MIFPRILRRALCLIFFSVIFGVLGLVPAQAGQWYTLKTKYLTLTYENPSDLKLFNDQIDFSPDANSFSSFSNSGPPTGTGVEQALARKLDALIEKVQLILDMRKPINIIVRIYPDKTALHEAYFNIYQQKKELRAWYIFEYNTIYVNVQDLFAGMLAHESAHAIVDHFLAVRPPRATAEILARYVDSHLNEEAKIY
ncbi:MAG: hypothetical protein KKF12_08170 [Proteobacteria bacterium]|nr:hypothetical protein [Desulfobacula sp.]MBU3951072.1 hypothetical protein [Pseudomonadota bacterium]MBU4130781.1 hypothetical protein [Pseudomonadota bacterium]